jgi:hypothetical protein
MSTQEQIEAMSKLLGDAASLVWLIQGDIRPGQRMYLLNMVRHHLDEARKFADKASVLPNG